MKNITDEQVRVALKAWWDAGVVVQGTIVTWEERMRAALEAASLVNLPTTPRELRWTEWWVPIRKLEMQREEIIEGLKSGKILNIVRKDAPELPIVLDLENEGLVTTELKQIDEQSSCLRVKWIPNEDAS